MFLDAVDRADRESWEFVEESAIREALKELGYGELLNYGGVFNVFSGTDWRMADVSSDDEDPQRRWYYPSESEPRPEEFRRFHQLLTESPAAPDEYEPHYFRVAKASKDPATQFGSWKTPDARLTVDEAVEWMEQGGNVGLAGRGPCEGCGGRQSEYCEVCEGDQLEDALINIDIDNDEETSPGDIPNTLRAVSRSRTGWHAWGFNHEHDVPNIPTEEYGEIRTDWQYVVAPGSFVASTSESIPAGAEDPGYYTIADDDSVAGIDYEDLPPVFHTAYTEAQASQNTDLHSHSSQTQSGCSAGGPSNHYHSGAGSQESRDFDPDDVDGLSAVFGVDARELTDYSDPSDRFTSIFHESGTHSNMKVGDNENPVLTCWRHNVAHGGLQALAVLSDVEHVAEYGCMDLGGPHENSNVPENKLKGDWRLIWGAWHEAKQRELIDDDDPLPYRVLRGLALEDGLLDRDELLIRDSETGDIVEDEDADDGDERHTPRSQLVSTIRR
jgi:hypothetical protein